MYRKRNLFLFVFTLLALLAGAVGAYPAQAVDLTFTNMSTTHGLGGAYKIFSDGNTIYVATREGLSISYDNGSTFTHVYTTIVRGIYASGNTVYVASQGGGFSISTDNGNTFNATSAVGLNEYTSAVYVDNNIIYVGASDGLYISTDGGATFTNKTIATVYDVYASGSNVYAATDGGLSISTDGGATFTKKTTANGLGGYYVRGVYASGSNVYAATSGGLSISTDGGATFVNRTTANGLGYNDVSDVFVSGGNVYASTYYGLSISTDNGNSFVNYFDEFPVQVYEISVNGSSIYALTNSGLYISTNNGLTYTPYIPATGLASNYVKKVYASGNIIYAATDVGLSISNDGGNTFANRNMTNGMAANEISNIFVDGSKIYLTHDGDELHGLSISTDGGATFTKKTESNGIGGGVNGSGYLRDVYANDNMVYTAGWGVSISSDGGNSFIHKTTANGLGDGSVRGIFVSDSKIYAATGGGLSISTNGGASFTNITTSSGLGSTYTQDVFVSGGTVYVATNSGLSISTNGGFTFTNKTTANGLGDNFTHEVYANGNTVYVATRDGGLSVSTDGGNTFVSYTIADGLGGNDVYGVYASGNTIYAATSGGLSIATITPPSIVSFVAAASPISSFNIPITLFTALDDAGVTGYMITESATPPSASAVGWTGIAPTVYTVNAEGSYTLYPWAKNALGGVSLVFSTPLNIVVDTTAPTVTSIVRKAGAANPTYASEVEFTVTFSEDVVSVDAADFKLTNTFLTGAYIKSISGTGAVYTVTANTGTGNGSIRLDLRSTATIQDLTGNAITGPYLGGQTYNVWKGAAPTVPVISAPLNTALVTNTPTLSWGESSAVMALSTPGWHYEVNITAPNGFNQNYTTQDDADVEVGLGRTSLTITDPLPDLTTFTWKVRAYNDTNYYSAWSLPRTFKTVLVPELNSPINNETLDNKRPTFEWDEVPGATGYTVQVLKNGVAVLTVPVKAPAYTYTLAADLLPSTPYTWRVMAATPIGGVYSQPLAFTTSANPPTVPLQTQPIASAVLVSNPAQVLDWNSVLATTTTFAAMSYELQYANNNQFIGATFNSVFVDEPNSQHTISTLPGRTYYWRVRAYAGASGTGNYSAWSAVRSFNVKFAAPLLVTPVAGASGVGNRPTFTWNANGNGIWTTFTIEVANDAAFTQTLRVFTAKTPKTSYTIPNTVTALSAGTKYWRVKINGIYIPITSATQIFTP